MQLKKKFMRPVFLSTELKLIKKFKILGMTCVACTKLISDNAKEMTGVRSVDIHYSTEMAILDIDERFNESDFINRLKILGYSIEDEKNSTKKILDLNLVKAIISLLVGLLMMGLMFSPLMHMFNHKILNSVELLIAFLFILMLGKVYLMAVIEFFTKKYSSMNTLLGVGILAAFIYSLVLFIIDPHRELYVEAIPFIIGFTHLGHFFEKIAKTKAKNSLQDLYKLQIKFVSKIVNKIESKVPAIEIVKGDFVRVRAGEKIPLNGEVMEGFTHVDESHVSGESIPVKKTIADKVVSGSLNIDGSFIFKVEDDFKNSFVNKVISFVEEAEKKKAPVEKYADKIVTYFVPAILLIAILTAFIWYLFTADSFLAIKHFIAVLVIACPCALGLAVPMAFMISTRKSAEVGLLVNGGEVFEIGEKINSIVMDKTGTLTEGKPFVVNEIFENEKFHELIYSSSSLSTHPLSKAIVNFYKEKNYKIYDASKFKNLPGQGLRSVINDHYIIMGNAQLLEQENIIFDLSKFNNFDGSRVYVAIDGKFVGVFFIEDKIKEESFELIKNLNELKIDVWMLSGDNEKTAIKVANKLGIKNVLSNKNPNEKAQFINELKKTKCVAMVGDGINDAAALSIADLGISMGNGSDVAISTSKVSLIDGKILLIDEFLKTSKYTMKIIRQNLFLSFAYNLLCIPLAAGVFYPVLKLDLNPAWASLAMGLSSVSVILSSLRLKKKL
jgi:Cu+-exporting ATPase